MKRVLLILAWFPSLVLAACPQPYVFFDLGDTLIDTKTYHYRKMFYMPGAYEYVKRLRALGVHMGLLVNYPDSAGSTVDAKIADLKSFIRAGWWLPTPSSPAAFDWSDYDQGVFVPPRDSDYKPKPYLYQQAMALARAAGCRAIFQGEDQQEVDGARRQGMHGRNIATAGYVPADQLNAFAAERK